MTRREQVAEQLEAVEVDWEMRPTGESVHDEEVIKDAVAELRKSCASCHWWSKVLFPNHGGAAKCTTVRHLQMPEDGSGFCHEWVSK